jgi:sodium/potassium-transporting ATPase subunit alpha
MSEGKDIELGTKANQDDIIVNIPQIALPHRNSANDIEASSPSNANINARRSGSASIITRNERGEIVLERKTTDLTIAIKRRITASSLPSIIPVSESTAKPLINAEDALERTGGKGAAGAYSEHMYPIEVLAEKFSTHIDHHNIANSKGLTSDAAKKQLENYGPNMLTPPPKVPLWLLFLLQFTNLLMVLLMTTALLCIILFLVDTSTWPNLYIGVLLFVVVFITCYETFSQEAKSDSLMEQFRALVPEAASVLRDGILKPVETSELVIGDIIRLKSGDKVPADCRIIQNESMKVDQSMITGESEPVDTGVNAHDPNALEARNIIFNGSLVVDGGCLAVVIRTGDATLIGTMVELTGDVGKSTSTLKADIDFFVKLLTIFALIQAALIFIVGIARGLDPIDVFIQGFITIMIGNVPQGLPTTVTACLYIVAEGMTKQNVLVKKLDIIETLGSCTLICTDKTGTLTMNQMSVANIWVPGKRHTNDEFETSAAHPGSLQEKRLMEIAVLNSRVVLEKKKDDGELEPTADATELGFYHFFSKFCSTVFGLEIEQYRTTHKKVHEIPFNSAFKWQMSIHADNNKQVLYLKGAPDVLLGKCGFYLTPAGEVLPIDDEFRETYTTVYEDFGGNGERVLGFAYKPMERTFEEELAQNSQFKEKLKQDLIGKDTATPVTDLVFVGLITLLDPPRAEVPQAVRDCHTAGVKV